jgi:hypothetical protein
MREGPDNLKEALREVADESRNWSNNFLFDSFARANLATDGRGTLILLDPIFNAEILFEDMKARKKKQQNIWRKEYE